jgi:hypothetical protein
VLPSALVASSIVNPAVRTQVPEKAEPELVPPVFVIVQLVAPRPGEIVNGSDAGAAITPDELITADTRNEINVIVFFMAKSPFALLLNILWPGCACKVDAHQHASTLYKIAFT